MSYLVDPFTKIHLEGIRVWTFFFECWQTYINCPGCCNINLYWLDFSSLEPYVCLCALLLPSSRLSYSEYMQTSPKWPGVVIFFSYVDECLLLPLLSMSPPLPLLSYSPLSPALWMCTKGSSLRCNRSLQLSSKKCTDGSSLQCKSSKKCTDCSSLRNRWLQLSSKKYQPIIKEIRNTNNTSQQETIRLTLCDPGHFGGVHSVWGFLPVSESFKCFPQLVDAVKILEYKIGFKKIFLVQGAWSSEHQHQQAGERNSDSMDIP